MSEANLGDLAFWSVAVFIFVWLFIRGATKR